MQTMLRKEKSFGTYAISTQLKRSLHERRDHLHTQLAHKREAFQHMHTLAPIQTLVACVYKAPSAISNIITVAGMREKITAAITDLKAGLPSFVILSPPGSSILSWIKWVQPVSIKKVVAAEG